MDQLEQAPTPAAKPKKRWVLKVLLYGILLLAAAAVAIPNFVRSRTTTCKNACINNLRQIDGAKAQWSLEKKIADGEPVMGSEVDQYIKGGAPKCPGGGVYSYNKVNQAPTCSLGHTL